MSTVETIGIKSRSTGCTWNTIPESEPVFKNLHLVFYCDNTGTVGNRPIIAGCHYPVKLDKTLVGKSDEPFDIFVPSKCLADIVDLDTPVFCVAVRKKEDLFCRKVAGSNINKSSSGILPDAMELCLNHDFWPLPESPTVTLFASVRSDLLWHDTKTFKKWLSRQRFEQNPDRITLADIPAE